MTFDLPHTYLNFVGIRGQISFAQIFKWPHVSFTGLYFSFGCVENIMAEMPKDDGCVKYAEFLMDNMLQPNKKKINKINKYM